MRTREKAVFLGLFFVSGACGLTYEIVWSRLLVFVFGGTTLAVTTVLTCFMGGLALGSWLAGRASERRSFRRPARLYGVLEIFIGLAALLVPVAMEWSTGLYRVLEDLLGQSFLLLSAARVLVSAAILVLPTAAMGATLPLLAAAFTRRRAEVGGDVAALYGANTFGAFVGCAGAGFWLLPRLGLSGSIYTAAALNLAAGAVALAMSRRPAAGDGEAAVPAAEEPKSPEKKSKKGGKDKQRQPLDGPSGRTILCLYGLSGFAAMAYQVAWTRALILSMGSSTYSFSTIVACYIFGLAAGSLAMTRWVGKLRRPLSVAGLLQSTIALSALFVVPLFGELPKVVARATASPGAGFGSVLFLEAAWVFGLLIVPTLCMGALLPLICRIYDPSPQRTGRSVGDVYAANTAGTILGAALAGFVLIPLAAVGMERTLQLASVLNLAVGTWFLVSQRPARTRRLAYAALAWGLAALAAGVTEPWSRKLMTSGPYLGRTPGDSRWELVFYREGIDATVSVERSREGLLSLSVNGKPDASTLADDMITQTLIGALPMLQRPDAKRVCLVGLGSGVSAGAILAFDVERLDVAEISPAVVDASRLFDEAAGAPLDDPRTRLFRADGRNFLLLGEPRSYDAVVSEPSNPWISGIANLFTREFFELSRSRLVEGGVHAQWLHGYSMEPDDFAAVLHTLEEVFGHVQVWEMAFNDYLFLASTEPLPIDVEGLFLRFARRPVLRGMLEQIHVVHPIQLAAHYVGDGEHMASWLDGARVLTDDLPTLEFSAPRSLLRETRGRVAARLFGFAGEPRLAGDPSGVLQRRFLDAAAAAKQRARRFRDALEALDRGDASESVAALTAVVEAAPEDLRTLSAAALEVQALSDSGVDVAALEERLARVDEDAWPFARRSPWPMAEALAYAGRRLVDGGGDLDEAISHLLRAWLRAPEDGRVIHDLARAYAARGDRERAAELFAAARDAGFAGADDPASEP